MTPKDRMKMLSMIWKVYTLFGLLIIVFSEGMGAGILLLGLALMTLLATLIITWSRVVDEKSNGGAISSKAKHSDTALVDRLIESMNDAELVALRKRLTRNGSIMGDDGELVSLVELSASKNISNNGNIG